MGIRGTASGLLYVFASLLIALLIGVSCAPHSYEIRSAEVSPRQYRGLDCSELHAELNQRLTQLDELGRSIIKDAEAGETQAAVGVILFWRYCSGWKAAKHRRHSNSLVKKINSGNRCEYQERTACGAHDRRL